MLGRIRKRRWTISCRKLKWICKVLKIPSTSTEWFRIINNWTSTINLTRPAKGGTCFIKSWRRSWKSRSKKKKTPKDEGTPCSTSSLMNMKKLKRKDYRLNRGSSRSSKGDKKLNKRNRNERKSFRGRCTWARRSMMSCHSSTIKTTFGTWLAMSKASKMAIRIKKIFLRWGWAKLICLILRSCSWSKMQSFWIRL